MRRRAARFQTDFKAPEYKPAELAEDEQKKAQRAARFGTEYAPRGGALMEIGAPHAATASWHQGRTSSVACTTLILIF